MTLRISPSIASLLAANSSIAVISWSLISICSIRLTSLPCCHETLQGRLRFFGLFLLAQRGVNLGKEAVDGRIKRVDLDRFLQSGRGVGEILGYVVRSEERRVGKE